MEENKRKNDDFQLKQFQINHKNAALKVTTEALILGAYVAKNNGNVSQILDIGTGTGLLALMLAQKSNAKIDAVEIEEKSYLLALENIQNSKFSNQINLFYQSIQNFEPKLNYDLIVSNPPFYTEHLKSTNTSKNTAIHTEMLSFSDLALAVKRLLNKNGKFVALLPPFQMKLLEKELLQQNLLKTTEFQIQHRENLKVLRIIATFEYNMSNFRSTHFFIKNNDDNYTQQFIELLKDYYIIF